MNSPNLRSFSEQLFFHESDRGAVLVGVAFLDEALTELLKACFVTDHSVQEQSVQSLFKVNGPLVSFWAKTNFANALGILSPHLFSDLEIIRKLRNRFAHQKDLADFNAADVGKVLEPLSTTPFYSEGMKGKRYKPSSKGKAAPSDARLLEAGFIKYYKGVFSLCVEHSLRTITTTTSIVSRHGIDGARHYAQNDKVLKRNDSKSNP